MFNIDKFITVTYLKQVWTRQDVLYACHTGLIFHYTNRCEALYQIYKMYNEWLLLTESNFSSWMKCNKLFDKEKYIKTYDMN